MYGIAKHQIQDNDNSGKKEKWMGLGVSIPKDLILTHNDLRKSCTWCKISKALLETTGCITADTDTLLSFSLSLFFLLNI